MLLMTVIYALIAVVGAQSYGLYADQLSDPDFNGGTAFAVVAQHYLGNAGMIVLALTVTFCCMKTAIGLITACADTFFGDIPKINGIQGMGYFVYCIFTASVEYRAVKDNIILSACSVFPVPVGYCTYSAQHIRKIL